MHNFFKSSLSKSIFIALTLFNSLGANANEQFNHRAFINLQAQLGIARGMLLSGVNKISTTELENAADAGSSVALFLVAKKYYCGDDVPQNMELALSYLERMTYQGSSIGPWLAGIAYQSGDGVRKDKKKAFKYLEMSAYRGNPYAVEIIINNLRNNPANRNQLLWWLSYGASHGEAHYQLMLANELAKASDPVSLKVAYYWLLEASRILKSEQVMPLINQLKEKVDPTSAQILTEGVSQSGKFRWDDWNKETMVVGSSILPCMRHIENTELSTLMELSPRFFNE
jgi:hypothetical protein